MPRAPWPGSIDYLINSEPVRHFVLKNPIQLAPENDSWGCPLASTYLSTLVYTHKSTPSHQVSANTVLKGKGIASREGMTAGQLSATPEGPMSQSASRLSTLC